MNYDLGGESIEGFGGLIWPGLRTAAANESLTPDQSVHI
jgi:hypothetical protein